MGRLILLAGAALVAVVVLLANPQAVSGFDAFGAVGRVDSTYGEGVTFDGGLRREAPEQLELLIRTPGSETALVAPTEPGAGGAEYLWDTAENHLTPNTLVTYQWRAISDGEVTTTLRQRRSATTTTDRVLTGRASSSARRRCTGTATPRTRHDASARSPPSASSEAEALLGTELAGPVDVFVYESQEDFFGALGPGAREWTGAAAYSEIRTIFMWLGRRLAGLPRSRPWSTRSRTSCSMTPPTTRSTSRRDG